MYIVPESDADSVMPLKGFIMNNGFEINPNSIYSSFANWNFPGGAKHQIISENDAPEGFQYLKVTDRSESSDVEQWLHLPSDFNDDWLIEMRYWAKFDYQDKSTEPSGEDRHNRLLTKITMYHYPYPSNGNEKVFYLQCHKACMIPDNKWRQYHATCNIANAVRDSPKVDRVGLVDRIKWYITGPNAGIDVYIDDVSVNYYERNRDWVSGADLRIEELRTQPVTLRIHGERPPGKEMHDVYFETY